MADAIMARRGKPKINYAKDWQYTTNDTATLVTKYIGTKTSVIVPNKIEGKPVVLQNTIVDSSGSGAYNGVFAGNQNIKSVKFEEGVSFANNNMHYAFHECLNLISAPVIPTNVTDLSYAFVCCANLASTPNIPSKVTNMQSAFSRCLSITDAPTIPASVTIMTWTFSGCQNLVNAPNMSNAKNVTNMYRTFQNCTNLKNAPVIPANVTDMVDTFYNCYNLVNAPVIPANVTRMGGTFSGCINLINVPVIPANVTNVASTFYNCTNLVNAPVIPANVTSMYSTFCYCRNLKNAPVIPNSVTNMGYTFAYCYNLTGNIYIKSNRINNTSMQSCFYGTTLPKNVYIPATGLDATNNTWNAAFNTTYGINGKNGVTVIDDAALDWAYTTNDTATLLTKYTGTKADVAVPATLAAKPTVLSTSVFKGTSVNSVDLGGVNFASNNMANTFNSCTSLKGVTNLVNTVTEANDAFHGCANLKSVGTYNDARVQFSNGVNLFRNCRNLISAPNHSFKNATATGVFNISHAFENCSNLTTANSSMTAYIYYMKTDDNVKPVDASYMFANCTNFTAINEDFAVVRSVGWNSNYSHMFYNCRSLTNTRNTFYAIYAGWNSNCSNMYSQCVNLKSSHVAFLHPDDNTADINICGMYSGCMNLTEILGDLPRTTKMVRTFVSTKVAEFPAIPNSVTNMSGAFYSCSRIVNAPAIPSNVTNMSEAFYYCRNLVNAPDIPEVATDLSSTFASCYKIVSAPVIPSNVMNMSDTFYDCYNLTGDVMIFSNKINSSGLNMTFMGADKPKNVYMYNTGYNATANSWAAAHNASVYFNGYNGVNVINMGVWENASWTYTTSGTNTLVTEYKGTNNTVYVPSKINGRNVVLQNSVNSISGVFTENANITGVRFDRNVGFTNNNMYSAFRGCTNLISVSGIPANTTDATLTFDGCENLINAPVIPASVTDMERTFLGCRNLVNAPVIPAKVTNMYGTFWNCTNLTGNIKIMSNRIVNAAIANCFYGTTKTKNVYIPFTGYNSLANTHAAAINSTYGINGKNGVTIYDINTYTG